MSNKDMPAMPFEDSGFGQYKPETYHGLTKREMFAMNAPDMPSEFYGEFFHKYNKLNDCGFISQDEPCLTAKGVLAANKDWRYAYADMMLED